MNLSKVSPFDHCPLPFPNFPLGDPFRIEFLSRHEDEKEIIPPPENVSHDNIFPIKPMLGGIQDPLGDTMPI